MYNLSTRFTYIDHLPFCPCLGRISCSSTLLLSTPNLGNLPNVLEARV